MVVLPTYDRLLREWIIEVELDINRIDSLFSEIHLNIKHELEILKKAGWVPAETDWTDRIEIEKKRAELLAKLEEDMQLINKLAENYKTENEGQILDTFKEIQGFVRQWKPAAQFCDSFYMKLTACRSLMSSTSLDDLLTQFNQITKDQQELFQPLRAFVVSKITQEKELHCKINRFIDDIKKLGEEDDPLSGAEVENRPEQADAKIKALEELDPENVSNWRDHIQYKDKKYDKPVQQQLTFELEAIKKIRNAVTGVKDICKKIGKEEPKDFTTHMDRAEYEKALLVLLKKFGLEFVLDGDMEMQKFLDNLREDVFSRDLRHILTLEAGARRAEVISFSIDSDLQKFMEASGILDDLDHDEALTKLKNESLYVQKMIGDIDEAKKEAGETQAYVLKLFEDFATKLIKWNQSNIELERLSDQYDSTNRPNKIFGRRAMRKRLEKIEEEISAELEKLDDVAPKNTLTKEKRQLFGLDK